MATRCSYHPTILMIPRKSSCKTATRALMQHNNIKQASTTLTKSCISNKQHVFYDQERGIACYRDEKGELVCEGYDEGPRISRQNMQDINRQKSSKVSDLQRLSRLRINGDGEFQAVNGIAAQWLN